MYKLIRPIISSNKNRITSYMVVALVLVFSSISIPVVTRHLINNGIAHGSSSTIILSAIGLGLIGVFGQLINLLSQSIEITIAQDIVKSFREKLSGNVAWLSDEIQDSADSGYLISRVHGDAQEMANAIRSITSAIVQFILFIASCILTSLILAKSIIVLLPTILVVAIIGILSYRIIHAKSLTALEAGAIASGGIGELLDGRATLISQGGRETITSNVISKQAEHILKVKNLLFSQTRRRTLSGIAQTIGLAVFLGWSGIKVASNTISFGDWYALNLYAGLLIGSIVSISSALQELGKTSAAADRIQELISYATKEKNKHCNSDATLSDGSVLVTNLSFSYGDSSPVLDNISLSIPPNSLALISGRSGVGKTTLCKIISGQLTPNKGVVQVGGKNPLPVGHASKKGTIAVLPQEIFIFNLSVTENIRLARNNASEYEIRDASIMAGIHEEVMDMDSGYDTLLGPCGNKISLGQKRRIALARSLISKPELIILDEPFASLDENNVDKLVKSLRMCTKICTVIVITHGWEDILNPDTQYVMQ